MEEGRSERGRYCGDGGRGAVSVILAVGTTDKPWTHVYTLVRRRHV